MLEKLLVRHPLHKELAERWHILKQMVDGGSAVDESVKKKLLTSPNCRSEDVINERVKLAPYLSLIGSILTRLQSHLLADKATYLRSPDTQDDFWEQEFFSYGVVAKKGRKSFHYGLKEATMFALTQGMAIAVVDVSHTDAENRLQQEIQGGTKPYIIIRSREDLWDWETDKKGLIFAKLHTFRYKRVNWDDLMMPEHEFTIYQRMDDGGVMMARYLIQPAKPKDYQQRAFTLSGLKESEVNIVEDLAPTEIFHLPQNNEKVAKFPVCILEFDESLCIADQLYDCQKSYFNQNAAAEWAMLSTNYAQLVFTDVIDEDELNDRITKTGDGYYWGLPQGVKVDWLERNGNGIDRALKYCEAQKAQMLEIISQIAISAASTHAYLSRSAESKQEDRHNMDIMMQVFGQSIAEFAKEILDIASIARGDLLTWSVDGFSNYDSDSFLKDLEQYSKSNQIINSPSFRSASQKKIASKAIEELGLNPELNNTIVEEIEQNNYNLDDRQLQFLQSLVSVGRLSNQALLTILKRIGILPPDFDIEQELNRLGTIPVNLQTANEEEILSE